MKTCNNYYLKVYFKARNKLLTHIKITAQILGVDLEKIIFVRTHNAGNTPFINRFFLYPANRIIFIRYILIYKKATTKNKYLISHNNVNSNPQTIL